MMLKFFLSDFNYNLISLIFVINIYNKEAFGVKMDHFRSPSNTRERQERELNAGEEQS